MVKKLILIWVVGISCCWTNTVWSKTTILVLGDSLSASYGLQQEQGWVALLNNRFNAQHLPYQLINASISGETTAGGLSRLESILTKQSYTYILIELGANDGLRGFSPLLMKNNLLQIIQRAKQHQVQPLLMDIQIPPNYGPRYTQLFHQVFKQLATQEAIPLLPFFMTFIATKPNLIQADGLHPNLQAQAYIVDIMEKELLKVLTIQEKNNAHH